MKRKKKTLNKGYYPQWEMNAQIPEDIRFPNLRRKLAQKLIKLGGLVVGAKFDVCLYFGSELYG